MRPRLLPALALCSAACCLLLCGLWAWSYWRAIQGDYVVSAISSEGRVGSFRGELYVQWWRPVPGVGSGVIWSAFEPADINFSDEAGGWAFAGFGVAIGGTRNGWMVWVPAWFPVLLTALPPAWWAWKRRGRGSRGFEVATSSSP